jgi:hypothetical protein
MFRCPLVPFRIFSEPGCVEQHASRWNLRYTSRLQLRKSLGVRRSADAAMEGWGKWRIQTLWVKSRQNLTAEPANAGPSPPRAGAGGRARLLVRVKKTIIDSGPH